jgi:hypothetical protein
MTDVADEQAQTGPGAIRDVVEVQLLDPELLVAARIARSATDDSATVTALAVAGAEQVLAIEEEGGAPVKSWDRAAAGPLEISIEEPLSHWTLTLDAPGLRLDLDLRAVTPPASIEEAATASAARAAGLHGYTQLGRARGSAELTGGRARAIDAPAVRTHRWGPPGAAARTRFVTAASEDGTLLTVAAVQPAGVPGHGEELVGGHTTRAGENGECPTLPFETVRLSTVFGEQGLPVKAGAELFRPGQELPSRLAGVAAAGVATRHGDATGSLTLFRFRLDGAEALGTYDIEAAT